MNKYLTAIILSAVLCMIPCPMFAGTLDCASAIDVLCGDIVSGSTLGKINSAEDYACNALFEDGKEQVFILTLTGPATVTATINAGIFFNIYLLTDCDEDTCIDWNPDSVTHVLPAGNHYFVLDNSSTWPGGPYEVEFSCVLLPTPTPLPIPVVNNDNRFILCLIFSVFILVCMIARKIW